MKQSEQNVSPMSNEGRNNYVIEHIREAFLCLLKEKSIDQITITELCDMAGVGRASFYRNYNSKDDIVKSHLNQIISEWIEEYDRKDNFPLSEQVRGLFTHFEKNIVFYKLLYDRNLIYLLKDVLLGIYGPKPEDNAISAYSKDFVAYTLYGWIEVWFQRGMHESAEELANMFSVNGL
ncbi:TetR/AcrR family transcriptional regulator [Hominimerdicola sp. 21CYCFAH17_S]